MESIISNLENTIDSLNKEIYKLEKLLEYERKKNEEHESDLVDIHYDYQRMIEECYLELGWYKLNIKKLRCPTDSWLRKNIGGGWHLLHAVNSLMIKEEEDVALIKLTWM